jgi:hypothetical protein
MLAFWEALARFAASFMEWFQQSQLIQAGRNEAELDQLKQEKETRGKLDEIDSTPNPTDPESILSKL